MANADVEWWNRLRAEVRKAVDAGSSYQQLAKEAGQGRNYVQQMMKNGKAPRADAVAKLCKALGVSVTYIFTGARMTAEAEEMLTLFSRLDETAKDDLLKLLKTLTSSAPNDEVPP